MKIKHWIMVLNSLAQPRNQALSQFYPWLLVKKLSSTFLSQEEKKPPQHIYITLGLIKKKICNILKEGKPGLPGLNGEPDPRGLLGFPGAKGAARNPKAPRVSSQSRIAWWPDVLLLSFCIRQETKTVKGRRAIWAEVSLA